MNNCSGIDIREARNIQGLFFDYIKDNDNITKFINEDLANYLSNKYERPLRQEELEFFSRTLDSSIITYKNLARKINISKQENNIFDVQNIERIYKTLVNAGPQIEENLFKINSIIEASIRIPEAKSNLPEVQDTPIEKDLSNTLDETLYQESKIDTFSGIKNVSDVDHKLYKGAFGAKLVMERLFSNGIIRRILVDSKNALYNNNSEYIDKAIKDYKSGLYSELVNYIKQNSDLLDKYSDQYYINGKINPEVSKVYDEIGSFYKDKMGLTNSMLNTWSNYSGAETKEKLFAYSKYIILNNFDNLLSIHSGKIFKIDASYLNNITESYDKQKYHLGVHNNLMSNFITSKEQFDILSEQTALYKLLIKSLPFVNKNGEIDLGKNVQVSGVNYTAAKLLRDVRTNLSSINTNKLGHEKLAEFDRTNAAKSFKNILEYVINTNNVGNKYDLPSTYNEAELSILRTLYLGVFKTDNNLESVVGTDFYNKMKESGALDILGPSLYEISLNTASKTTTTDLDYFDVLVHNFSKVFLNNYVENTYDPDLKTINSSRPSDKVTNTQKILLRNNLRHFSNQKIDPELLKDEFSEVNVDLNKGQVSINTSNLPILIDIKKGFITYDGKRLSKTNKPSLNEDLSNDTFLKSIEYHTGLNVASNPDLMSSLVSEIDAPKSNHQTIERLARVAGYTIFSKNLLNSERFDSNNVIKSLKKLPYLSEKISKNANIWDNFTKTLSISGMSDQIPHDISAISKGLSLIRGDFSKAVVKTSAGVTMPLHGNIRHIYNIKDFLNSLTRDNAGLKGMPIEGNLFANNSDMIKEPIIRTYSQVFEKNKHSSELYPEEINTSQILYEFYGSLMQIKEGTIPSREVLLQTSVFADKNTAYSIPINMTKPISLKYFAAGKVLTVNKNLIDASIDELKDSHFYSEYTYYKNIGNTIHDIYNPVLRKLVGDQGFFDIGEFMKGKKYNASGKNSLEITNDLMGFFDEKTFRDAFYNIHGSKIPLIQDLGISKVNGKIGLSESLVKFSTFFLNNFKNKPTEAYEERMNEKLKDFTINLEKTGFKLEYRNEFNSENPILKESADILEINSKPWIDDKTGYMILRDKKGNINPFIERYFWTHNLVTDNFQTIVTGKIHNHPTKGINKFSPGTKDYYDRMETLKTGMYLKRQLQGTPMDTFAQGLINGIREKTKTVFLTDIDLPTYNVYGTNDKMTVTDGSTIMTMLQGILQNNSLLDKAVGMNQKTLGLSIDPIYNSYGLMKHCAFGITNEDIRNSIGSRFSYDDIYKKGYGISLSEPRTFGETSILYTPDLLTDYAGNKINIDGSEKVIGETKVWITGLADQGLYYLGLNNHIIKITDFDYAVKDLKTGKPLSNDYIVRKFDVTSGQEIESQPFKANTLYDIWKEFGGENSLSIDPEGKYKAGDLSFTDSDSSHYALANLVNKVGSYRDNFLKENLKAKHSLTDEQVVELFNDIKFRDIDRNTERPDQSTVWQPLKDKFIGQFQFASSQKSGAGSIQNTEEVLKSEGLPIHTEVSTLSTGVLMDPDHVIDSTDPSKVSDITEMTQIVQAQEFNGDTHNITKESYEALAQLTRVKLLGYFDTLQEFKNTGNEEDKMKLYNKVVKQLIASYKTKTQSVSNQKMIEWVENSLNTQKQLEGQIGNEEDSKLPANIENLDTLMPFSAQSVYNGFVSTLSNMFNKLAIKRKHSGIASVLKPSGAFVQMYDIPTFDENNNVSGFKTITGDRMNREYNELKEHKIPSKRGDISLYDWIEIDGVQTYIDTPKLLIQVKSQGTPEDNINIVYGKPRDLKPPDFKFTLEGNTRSSSIFETDEYGDAMAYDNIERGKKNDPYYTKRLKALAKSYEIEITSPEMKQAIKNQIQNVMKRISSDKIVTIKGIAHNITNVESIPGEAMGPNIYRKKFGLPKGVSIDEVNEQYILDILNNNSLSKVKEANYYIRSIDGNHMYVFLNKPNDIDFNSKFVDTDKRIEKVDGENWTLNEFGEKVYNVGDLNLKKYFDGGVLHDAIIIDSDQDFPKLYNLINSDSDSSNAVDLILNDNISTNIITKGNQDLAKRLFSSFQVSNEYTSARIPGQGAQSFTPLRLVDFINTQSNTIMTNHHTSWLKGEDYDVDKGFWLGVTLGGKGVVGWSKDFDFSSGDSLRQSLKLPMPDIKTRSYNKTSKLQLTPEEEESLYGPISDLKISTLQKIKNNNDFGLVSPSLETIERLSNKINNYFGEKINTFQMEAAVKNKIARSMYETILAPETQVHAGSPIGMDDPRNAALAVEDKFKYTMSLNDPSLIAELQYQNMEGKGTIGIGAVALKVFSGLSYWANEKVRQGKFSDITFVKDFKSKDKTNTYVSNANINFGNTETKDAYVQHLKALLGDDLVKEISKRINLNDDKSLTLSALLSAATDNAKELILSKINAGTATAGVYAHLTMMGVPFLDIADMMTSEPVQWIVNYAKGNIFDKTKEFRNVDSAIKAYLQGPNVLSYMSQDDFRSINKHIKNLLLNNKDKLGFTDSELTKLNNFKTNIFSAEILRADFKTKIDKILSFIKDNIPKNITKSKVVSQEEELEDFTMDYLDNPLDEGTGSYIRAKIPVGRFIDGLEKYFSEVLHTDSNLETVEQFKKAYDDAKEITILGAKFGINQGMKTDSYTQYKFFADMDAFWHEQVYKGPDSIDKSEIILSKIMESLNISKDEAESIFSDMKDNFSFKKFISGDDKYKKSAITIYDGYKSTYNILDILNSVPHFAEMLKVPILADDVQNTVSVKYRTLDKMVNEVFDKDIIARKNVADTTHYYNPVLSDKNYIKLSDFTNDVLISKWLKNLDFSIDNYSKDRWNEKLVKETLPDSVESYPIDISTVHGRMNFIDMFENMVTGLQKGYTKHNGKIVYQNSLKNNLFIKDLVVDFRKDPLSGNQEKYYRLPINILSTNDFDVTQVNNYILGYQNLGSTSYEGKPIKDLFFIYNTVINRDKINKDSFTKLFEYDTKFTKDSLMYKYIDFLGKLDNTNDTLKDISESSSPDYNIEDLILKGFANKVMESQLDSGKFFGKYVFITYSDGERFISEYYHWVEGTPNKNGERRGDYIPYTHLGNTSIIPLSTDNIVSMEKLNINKQKSVESVITKLLSLDNNFKVKTECHGV